MSDLTKLCMSVFNSKEKSNPIMFTIALSPTFSFIFCTYPVMGLFQSLLFKRNLNNSTDDMMCKIFRAAAALLRVNDRLGCPQDSEVLYNIFIWLPLWHKIQLIAKMTTLNKMNVKTFPGHLALAFHQLTVINVFLSCQKKHPLKYQNFTFSIFCLPHFLYQHILKLDILEISHLWCQRGH